MLDLPLADSNGAVLISKKQFNKLDHQQQVILSDLARQYFTKLTGLSREDNAKSLQLIKQSGIQFIENTDKAQLSQFYNAGEKARRDLVGKLYDEAFLQQVESLVQEYRSKHKSSVSE